MRRKDREVLGLDNILSILDKCDVIRIGLCVDHKPYIIPMNFAYEVMEETVYIYLHCASEGKKLDIIAQNHNVCFEADCDYQLVTAKEACNWTSKFQSVMGEGIIEVVPDTFNKKHALDLLMKRLRFEGQPDYPSKVMEVVTILKITVSSLTGKANK